VPRYPPRMVGAVIGAMLIAFFTGALARFALPGPDPMPPWLTIGIGLGGSAIGYGIVIGIGGRDAASWAGLASFVAAVGLVVIYRRFVQKRPLWGKDACAPDSNDRSPARLDQRRQSRVVLR
jgi:uncharacterized membrane protein YeaQ/YmgE (transglycosylase-associated protein family)